MVHKNRHSFTIPKEDKQKKNKFEVDLITKKSDKELRKTLQNLIFDVDPDFSNVGNSSTCRAILVKKTV